MRDGFERRPERRVDGVNRGDGLEVASPPRARPRRWRRCRTPSTRHAAETRVLMMPIGVSDAGPYVLAAAVRHEARRPQLAHVRVHQRRARPPLLPCSQSITIDAPLPRRALDAVREEELLSIIVRVIHEVVAPRQFKFDPVRALVGHSLLFIFRTFMSDAARRQAAPREPGRELRGVALADHACVCSVST